MKCTARASTQMATNPPRIPYYFLQKRCRPFPAGRNKVALCDGKNIANITWNQDKNKLEASFRSHHERENFFLQPEKDVDFEVGKEEAGPFIDIINSGLSNAYHQVQYKGIINQLESALLKCDAWDQDYQGAWHSTFPTPHQLMNMIPTRAKTFFSPV